MKKLSTLTIFLLFFITKFTWAQTNLNKVKVIDYATRAPIDAAVIKTENGKAVATNELGEAEIVNNDETFTISHIGYTRVLQKITPNDKVVLLKKGVINLQDVVLKNNTSPFKTISKIDLNTKLVKSSQELLRAVPGLFIAQHQGGGKAEQIFLRGFDIDHGTDIAISVDGLPVNMVSHAHGQGYADLHFVIPELVNKVDFGTGAYYANVGNFNTAGYVNFETLNKLDKSRIQLEVGQFNTTRFLTILDLSNKKNSRGNGYVAGEFLYSDGPFVSRQHFNRVNIFSKYNYKPSRQTDLNFLASAFNSRWDASGQVPERAIENGTIDRFGSIDDTEGGYTSRYNASVTSKTSLGKNTTLKQQLYFTNYKFNLFSNFTFFLNDPVNGDQIKQAENRNILGYNGSVSFQNKINNATLNTLVGIGLRKDNTLNSELSHTKNKEEILQAIKLGNIAETNAFVFGDEKITINKWDFNFGLRADYFKNKYFDKLNTQLPSQSQAIVSPKANVQYTINKTIQLYAKWGKGFHSNDTRVVVQNNGREILPASYGYDLGITLKPIKNLFINAAFWKLNLEQEFVYVGDEGVIEPSGKTKRKGVDLAVRYQLGKNLFFDVNYNTAKAKNIDNPKGKDYIPLAPTLTSIGSITYKTNKEWSGSIRYRYMKNRAANEDNTVIAKGYFVTDATINYTKPKYEIGLIIENLFNTKWNEAQFNTTSRLKNELNEVTELHYTAGVPFFAKVKLAYFF